jgi:hypothetical protein
MAYKLGIVLRAALAGGVAFGSKALAMMPKGLSLSVALVGGGAAATAAATADGDAPPAAAAAAAAPRLPAKAPPPKRP